jgi:hypothetical protein
MRKQLCLVLELRRFGFVAGLVLVLGLSSQRSEGVIIYTDIPDVVVVNGSFDLDVDGGGPDITFLHYSGTGGDGQTDVVSRVTGFTGSIASSPFAHADRLGSGDIIDGSLSFAGPGLDQTLASNADLGDPFNGRFSFGEWYPGAGGTETGYVGFEVGGRYGWVQVSVGPYVTGDPTSLQITILDYAIEMESGTSIQEGAVPEPSVMSLLAAGAAGALLRRRRG